MSQNKSVTHITLDQSRVSLRNINYGLLLQFLRFLQQKASGHQFKAKAKFIIA